MIDLEDHAEDSTAVPKSPDIGYGRVAAVKREARPDRVGPLSGPGAASTWWTWKDQDWYLLNLRSFLKTDDVLTAYAH